MPYDRTIEYEEIPHKSTDPRIRGLRGSVFAVANQSEKDYYYSMIRGGQDKDSAYKEFAEMVVLRASGAVKKGREPRFS